MKKSIIICMVGVAVMMSSCRIYKSYERPEDLVTEGLYRDPLSDTDTLSATAGETFGDLPWREVFTDPQLQAHMFRALGLSDAEAEQKFGFLTGAFKYGAPPHGGMGIGLDRLCMIMSEADTIRDVIAFPKVANSSELMSGAPANVDKAQLDDLAIAINLKEDKE
jgi:hypothetical protein